MAFHLSAGVLVGLGTSGLSFAIVLAAFGRLVPEEKRSLVFGIGTSAGSLGAFIVAPMGQAFIESYGWATALIILSIFVALAIPLAFPLRGRGVGSGPEQSIRQALTEAKQHSGFILLNLGFFVCGFHVLFIQIHLPAYVVDSGIDPAYGAWAIAVVGLVNVFGGLMAGYLGGKFSKKYLLSMLYFARAVAIAAFVMMPVTPVTVIAFAAVMGLLWLSTVPLTSGLVAQIFGLRHMGMLFGIVFFSHQVGAFLGVWLGGLLYDRTGSYDVIWWVAVALGLVAALLHWPIDERKIERPAAA
jgi:predicted MFS family arabinose efflux permease